MKLMTGYSVAVYTAENCALYDLDELDEVVDYLDQSHCSLPDKAQLISIQKNFSTCHHPNTSNLMILIPDDWLSISQHKLDTSIPSALLPLASLSYAVETTFSTPEALLFSYQQEAIQPKQCQLTVFACSADWYEQLCLPFKELGASCLVMSIRQWKTLKLGNKSWSYLSKRALSVYQPDYEKRKKRKRLWICLVLLSALTHSVAYGYYLSLRKNTEQALVDRQSVLAEKALWVSAQNSSVFVESALTLVQALPPSVRLVSFNGEPDVVSFQLTLSWTDLNILLVNWRKQYPSWHWQIERLFPLTDSYQQQPDQQLHKLQLDQFKEDPSLSLDNVSSKEQEVVDVSVSIFKK
ncbi:hypothetical protein [Marinomonas colpomeniae]|uniref:General secretion pathway protein L n=1 Tax=Marinomonas colpomeniae TaxID=2774408 RepID=A0ABR8P2V0_9GAMM|nr:hypothetical protein [Marinomonas colpomeniae]MBD5772498.1 hypothetical protein [Marinomonas colpomeniae]